MRARNGDKREASAERRKSKCMGASYERKHQEGKELRQGREGKMGNEEQDKKDRRAG